MTARNYPRPDAHRRLHLLPCTRRELLARAPQGATSFPSTAQPASTPSSMDLPSSISANEARYRAPTPYPAERALGSCSKAGRSIASPPPDGQSVGTADATTDFSGTGEQATNCAGNMGGRWNFFGNPADWKPTTTSTTYFRQLWRAQACPTGQSSCGIPVPIPGQPTPPA